MGQPSNTSLKKVALATLAVTLLNPHVYLDTMVILGGIGGMLDYESKFYFLAGALLASFLWFYSLGYGARVLTPLFARPKSWKILDFLIGSVMWFTAFGMARYVWEALDNTVY